MTMTIGPSTSLSKSVRFNTLDKGTTPAYQQRYAHNDSGDTVSFSGSGEKNGAKNFLKRIKSFGLALGLGTMGLFSTTGCDPIDPIKPPVDTIIPIDTTITPINPGDTTVAGYTSAENAVKDILPDIMGVNQSAKSSASTQMINTATTYYDAYGNYTDIAYAGTSADGDTVYYDFKNYYDGGYTDSEGKYAYYLMNGDNSRLYKDTYRADGTKAPGFNTFTNTSDSTVVQNFFNSNGQQANGYITFVTHNDGSVSEVLSDQPNTRYAVDNLNVTFVESAKKALADAKDFININIDGKVYKSINLGKLMRSAKV